MTKRFLRFKEMTVVGGHKTEFPGALIDFALTPSRKTDPVQLFENSLRAIINGDSYSWIG